MLPARTATVLTLAIAGAFVLFAIAPTAADTGHSGTVKVHDEETASPPVRNEPHVDCQDFWIEGFFLNASSGHFQVFSWPPTGDKTLVLETDWIADAHDHEHDTYHFKAGPFTLPAGHYRLEVTLDDGTPATKNKMFWVEECVPPVLECPPDLNLMARSDGAVEVTFTPVPGSDGTNLYRATGDGDFEYLTTLAAGDGSYVDMDVENGVTYTYMVTSLVGDSESEDCAMAEVTTIPDLPTYVAVGAAGILGTAAYALARRKQE